MNPSKVSTSLLSSPSWSSSRLVCYSRWPNKSIKNQTLHCTIGTQSLREFVQLPFKVGILTNRDLSLEVPSEELGSFNSRFVCIPELEMDFKVGTVGDMRRERESSPFPPAGFWTTASSGHRSIKRATWLDRHEQHHHRTAIQSRSYPCVDLPFPTRFTLNMWLILRSSREADTRNV